MLMNRENGDKHKRNKYSNDDTIGEPQALLILRERFGGIDIHARENDAADTADDRK